MELGGQVGSGLDEKCFGVEWGRGRRGVVRDQVK